MRVVLIGPPGAGKGTQAEAIKAAWPVAHISTGEMLRENVKRGSEIGMRAKALMDAGKLVSDELIIDMISSRLKEADASQGFILDGFPRTTAQAKALEKLLDELGMRLDAVVLLDIEDDEVVRRLSSRLICSVCGAIYNAVSHRPARDGVCDTCGGKVITRDDDREDVIRKRLAVYHEQTAPLVKHYEDKKLLTRVSAVGEIDSATRFLRTL